MESIAVILPCLNEELTIGTVIKQVKDNLPEAKIYVIDNDSDDNSVTESQKFDDVNIIVEKQRGKGNVIKRAFHDIDADIYVMVDADATYEICELPDYITSFVKNNIDYMNIARQYSKNEKFNPVRKLGNFLFTSLIKILFGLDTKDILSGFKIFSKKFVKEFEIKSKGFEIETEMYIFAKRGKYNCKELSCKYYSRIKNSHSKLSIINDGFNILRYLILSIVR